MHKSRYIPTADGAPPPPPRDIVLLEESDLYRYHEPESDRGSVIRADHFDHHRPLQQQPPPSPQRTYTKSSRRTTSYGSHHSSRRHGDLYAPHNTPFAPGSKRTGSVDTVPAHYGALRPGGPVQLFSHMYIGLLVNWMLIGFFNGSLPGLVYPLFGTYWNFPAVQQSALYALLNFSWSFKFVFGFVTDNYPINRQRRKPFIMIGWILFTGFMIATAAMKQVEHYWVTGSDPQEELNPDAPEQARAYVITIVLATFAQLLVNVSCEGLMVEFAHREGEYDRGRTQLMCVIFRFIGEMTGTMFATLSFYSEDYGGTFSQALPLSWFFAVSALLSFIGTVFTYFYLYDEKVPISRQNFTTNIRRVWRFIEQRTTILVMVSCFIITLAQGIKEQETGDMANYWVKMDPVVRTVLSVIQTNSVYIFVSIMMYVWFLNMNWRVLMVGGFVIASVIEAPFDFTAIWGVLRSGPLFLAKDWVGVIFEDFAWLLRLVAAVEVSEPGLESTSYGLITGVCNLANVVVQVSYNIVPTLASEQIEADTTEVRWHVTYEFIIKHVGRLVVLLLALPLFPRQKRHVKEIRMRGVPNLMIAILVLVVTSAIFVAAVVSAVLSMYESTSCLKFAGGQGCDKVAGSGSGSGSGSGVGLLSGSGSGSFGHN